MDKITLDFLRESNNIENEWGDKELQQAILAWQFILEQDELNTAVVLQTHKILMQDKLKDAGYLRRQPVWVAGREGKPFYALPELIENWCKDVQVLLDNKDKLIKLSALEAGIQGQHVQYEEIHPFIDGNGRTGRIFMNWERVKVGLPILVIKNSEKRGYYDWFDKTHDTVSHIDKPSK